MFVSAHAHSNCSFGWSDTFRCSTSSGTAPASMIGWMGGCRSIDSSFRMLDTASVFASNDATSDRTVAIHPGTCTSCVGEGGTTGDGE